MGTVVADMTMSVDGFVADPDDGVGALFEWYSEGSVPFTFPGDGRRMHVSEASAGHLDRIVSELGALVSGRRPVRGRTCLGRGIPFFSGLARYPVMLEDPVIVPGSRVTHMYFRVRR
ncbi:MAG TPA: hypothetical protein VHW96_15820 [Solirubrobacteraceae bacterium]|jgi:hypothetical protein|nr:hypothetical protein [Solirubrobacteraceae bacterium]